MATASNLTQDLHRVTDKVSDPGLRTQIEDACRALDINTQVLAVKDFRDRIPQVRAQAHGGDVVLVADRADVKDATDTTVVLSLATFQQFIAKVLETALEKNKRRSNTADFLAGLSPVTDDARSFAIDFERDASIEASLPTTDLKL